MNLLFYLIFYFVMNLNFFILFIINEFIVPVFFNIGMEIQTLFKNMIHRQIDKIIARLIDD